MASYNPNDLLNQIFNSPETLNEIPQLLNHTHQYKTQLNRELTKQISQYQHPSQLNNDILELITTLKSTKSKAASTQSNIILMTQSIQCLDQYKKNLVLSMKILKRLQMLIISNNKLDGVIQTHNYKEILSYFSVVKELMNYFKPYKSINEINQLNLIINKTQNKLIDDIFIDFEDSFTNNFTNNQLVYGCEILELIDSKYKDKLLNWFYNYQLKEIKSIFNNLDEAGNLENLNRRYIYFNNVLSNIQNNYLSIFPSNWLIDLELSKLFCKITKQDLINQLSNSNQIDSSLLLTSLTKTLDFENKLNDIFKTNDFDKIISKSFEPYLIIWVNEQDKFLSNKFIDFFQISKIPQEYIDINNLNDFLTILKVNNIPNIANSSIELFKIFHKILTQIIKLTNGEVLIDVSKVFIKYLYEYYLKHLLPIINQSIHPNQNSLPSNSPSDNIESIKYLTMVLNTADYIINNINDLQEKFKNLINEDYKDKISFELCHDWYFELINKSIICLLNKISDDLKFPWRQFENNNWNNMDSVNDVSTYMIDFKACLNNNIKLILPLIIRDGYIRNFCDKLIENIIYSFMNHLKLIKPLSILNIEQILFDLSNLKDYLLIIPLYSNPNYDELKNSNEDISKLYTRLVNSQFKKIETLLKLLLTPTLPVDNLIENYFQLIGDKSVANFNKILNLKDIDSNQKAKYIDNFNLQLTLSNDLLDESPILSNLDDNSSNLTNNSEDYQSQSIHPQSQPLPQQPDIKDLLSSKSPEPSLPEFLKSKSPRILSNNSLKINNFEKNLREFALNGENQVNKFNENFKNFGKLFRKDNNNE